MFLSFDDLHVLNVHTQAARMQANGGEKSFKLQAASKRQSTCLNCQCLSKTQCHIKIHLALRSCLADLTFHKPCGVQDGYARRAVAKYLDGLEGEMKPQLIDGLPDEAT